MPRALPHPLAALEPRLRTLLPADLYAAAWLDPSPDTLVRVFEHLRTLQHILYDYVPRQLVETLPSPGQVGYEWQTGTLMFTDLAGFTRLMEANAAYGREGAWALLDVLNRYFATMLEIISKSGGTLLEFTGDAMLVRFLHDQRRNDTAQAVRAGLRMQRAMVDFAPIETEHAAFSLGMRVGLHSGRFLTANIGTPRRMDHVLLGDAVCFAKRAEGRGQVGRVCLTEGAYERVRHLFRFESHSPGYALVVDDLEADQLGEYDFTPTRRLAAAVLLDRSLAGLLAEIESAVGVVELLASYLPMPILNLVVENTAHRQIAPRFPHLTVFFVSLIGLTEMINQAKPEDEASLIAAFSRAFTLINAAVEARGGVLKKTTYQLEGSDMLVFFGVPYAHADDPLRAAEAALAIRDALSHLEPVTVGGQPVTLTCRIGIAHGPAFAGEVGEPRGRREYNILGDTVNIAARLMGHAEPNQILLTEAVHREIAPHVDCESLGAISLKGKSAPMPVFALRGALDDDSR
jgi:adenylate cyclase